MNINELTPSEKIMLAEELWDSVASDANLIPLTDAQKEVLEARLKSFTTDPELGDSWENVKSRMST